MSETLAPHIEKVIHEIEALPDPTTHRSFLRSGAVAHTFKVGSDVLRTPHRHHLFRIDGFESRIAALKQAQDTPYFEQFVASLGPYVVTKFIPGQAPHQLNENDLTHWIESGAQQQFIDRVAAAMDLNVQLDTIGDNCIVNPEGPPQLHVIDYSIPPEKSHPEPGIKLLNMIGAQMYKSPHPQLWEPVLSGLGATAARSGIHTPEDQANRLTRLKQMLQ